MMFLSHLVGSMSMAKESKKMVSNCSMTTDCAVENISLGEMG